MVDVGSKPVTDRFARASAKISMQPETLSRIREMGFRKGNVLEVARLAGIMAAKRTPDLIPLCHGLPLSGVELNFEFESASQIRIEASVTVSGKTGVEMEAMTAVSVAALTIYDMTKSVDRGMVIQSVMLEEKDGGKSGHFLRQASDQEQNPDTK